MQFYNTKNIIFKKVSSLIKNNISFDIKIQDTKCVFFNCFMVKGNILQALVKKFTYTIFNSYTF